MDFKGITQLFQQAQKMREEVGRVQEAASHRTVETSSGGGLVKVVANGKQQIVSISIDPEVLKWNDKQVLEDLVRGAVNEAIQSSQQLMADEVGKLTGGLSPFLDLLKGS